MTKRFLLVSALAAAAVPTVCSAQVRQSALMDYPMEAQQLGINPAKVVTIQDRNARLAPKKILKTVDMKNGYRIQIVEAVNGMRYKRLLNPQNQTLQNYNIPKIVAPANAEGDGVAFFEGFESYQEDFGLDWIPEGWQEINTQDVLDMKDKYNLTWFTYYSGGMGFLPMTPEGQTEVFIHYSFDNEVEGEPDKSFTAVDQDEWLVTPLISVEQYQDLYFAMAFDYTSCYDSKYLDWNTMEYSKRELVCNMEVLIQEDGSSEWESLLNMEKDYASKLTDRELYNRGFSYEEFKVELDKYAGKKVKIAFRYFKTGGDFCGNSVCLDAVKVATPATDALYERPSGTFKVGTSRDFIYIQQPYLLGPAYAETTWRNYSSQYATDFEWSYQTSEEGEVATSTERDLSVVYPWGIAPVPTLNASALGAQTTSYTITAMSTEGEELSGYLLSGGTSIFNFQGYGSTLLSAGEYDISLGLSAPAFDVGQYCFGSGSEDVYYKTNYGFGTVYSAPAAKYIINGVWIPFYVLNAKDDVEFTLNLYKRNAENQWEKFATSTCMGSAIQQVPVEGLDPYIMEFTSFKLVDGGEMAVNTLEVDTELMLELVGFDNEGVTEYCPLNQGDNSPVKETGSFVLQKEEYNGTTYSSRTNIGDLLVDYYCPFLINVDVTYSFIRAEEPAAYFDKAGGNKDILLEVPYLAEALYVDDSEFPGWLTCQLADDEASGMVKLTVTADALGDETERYHEFMVTAPGAELKITVKQNADGSVETLAQQAVKVARNGNAWVLNYPQEITKVDVVNIAGQKVAGYQLSGNSFAVPTAELPSGVYMLVFNNGNVVKVIK